MDMEIKKIVIVSLGVCFGLNLVFGQNSPPVAVDDTMWTIPGYPGSVNALLNDYKEENMFGDTYSAARRNGTSDVRTG